MFLGAGAINKITLKLSGCQQWDSLKYTRAQSTQLEMFGRDKETRGGNLWFFTKVNIYCRKDMLFEMLKLSSKSCSDLRQPGGL